MKRYSFAIVGTILALGIAGMVYSDEITVKAPRAGNGDPLTVGQSGVKYGCITGHAAHWTGTKFDTGSGLLYGYSVATQTVPTAQFTLTFRDTDTVNTSSTGYPVSPQEIPQGGGSLVFFTYPVRYVNGLSVDTSTGATAMQACAFYVPTH